MQDLRPRTALDDGTFFTRAARAVLRAAWFGVIPALGSIVCLRYLLPRPSEVGLSAVEETLARIGLEHPVEVGAGFFLLFAVLVRVWQPVLPGGRYLSSLPLSLVPNTPSEHFAEYVEAAELHRILARHLARAKLPELSSPRALELGQRLDELGAALAEGRPSRVQTARAAAAEVGAALLSRRQRSEAVSIAAAIVGAALLALSLKTSVIGTYRVLSGSMLPTLRPNDHVMVQRLSYGVRSSFGGSRMPARAPHRGDVVVFGRDDGGGFHEQVKRVIGVPGDRVKMDGLFPVINGWAVPSCNVGPYLYVSAGIRASGRVRIEFLEDKAYLVLFGSTAPNLEREYVVGPDEVFVIGDNRSDSRDSRTYNSGFGGGIEIPLVEGRVDRLLYGFTNAENVDAKRLLVRLGTNLALDGEDVAVLEERIRSCLARRPKETRPPLPSDLGGPSASLSEHAP